MFYISPLFPPSTDRILCINLYLSLLILSLEVFTFILKSYIRSLNLFIIIFYFTQFFQPTSSFFFSFSMLLPLFVVLCWDSHRSHLFYFLISQISASLVELIQFFFSFFLFAHFILSSDIILLNKECYVLKIVMIFNNLTW